MTLGSLGILTFATPWMLAGLAALPVIWWLLRLMPPQPQTVSFPPTRLLLNLKGIEKTPVHSPWWLTLLRMLVAAAVIAALAGPILKPPASGALAFRLPVLVVVDNGWTAASRWPSRRKAAEQIADLAEEAGQPLYLVSTAGNANPLRPLSPAEFRQRFTLLTPEAFPSDRAATARAIDQSLSAQKDRLHVMWLADGVEDEGANTLRQTLELLSGVNKIQVLADQAGAGALGLFRPAKDSSGLAIRARITKAEVAARQGSVAAVTARGDRLGVAPYSIPEGGSTAEVTIDLPLELRNQVSRLEVAGEASAGAVFLLDSRSQRRRVGIVGSEEAEEAQPLLSPAHYLEKALAPVSDVILSRTGNLDQATQDLLSRSPSVVILSDVGRLGGAAKDRLQAFVDKGGTLIRFAGPRLEQGGDTLLPAPLREGGRTLGGAMTWASPQKPAAFERGSLFEGLAIPDDIAITRQVLTDPARIPRDVKVWARLADGTPLVTAAKRGLGQLIFFHITANSDWSNLPLSGLFPDLMRKIVDASPLQGMNEQTLSNPGATQQQSAVPQNTVLKAWRLLDGFGVLGDAGDKAWSIASERADGNRASANSPAGLYGPQNAHVALNIMTEDSRLMPFILPTGAVQTVFAEAKTVLFAQWLYLGALGVFLLEGLLSALVMGRRFGSMRKPAMAALFLCLAVQVVPPSANAQPPRIAATAEANAFALQASLETRIAYVVTGNDEVDRISLAGLAGLNKILNTRTAVEPGQPMGVDPARDELVFFPLIYWPVLSNAQPLPDHVLSKVDAYMRQGGVIVFDTKNDETFTGSLNRIGQTPLATLLGKLDLPPLQRVPEDHVMTKAFYLLQSFPGRFDNGDFWVEARTETASTQRGLKSDGVSSIIVTSNDLVSAWAIDGNGQPMFPTVPGGEEQREMSYRVGVNIVMYALTGNYKADQVHVPAILERLGH